MVFSQTSHKTQSILKVVEIDLLKAEKSQQVNGTTGVVTDRHTVATPSPAAAASYSEVFLKTEPEFPSTMTHESDYEFFEDLAQWCAAPAAAAAAQSIDIPICTEDRAHNTDTLHTPFSPQGWDVFDVNSSAQASFYKPAADPLSPSADGSVDFYSKYRPLEHENKIPFSEQFLDISSLPVVIEDLASRGAADMAPWEVPAPIGWHPHDTEHNKNNINIHNTMPFIEEDSLDMKMVSVIPREVESNDVVISEFILNDQLDVVEGPAWHNDDDIISTPEVLNYVEQLETEKCTLPSPTPVSPDWPTLDASTDTITKAEASPPMDYEPITPKSESHNEVESDNDDVKSYSSKKKRRDSEDSDTTYVPYTEHSPRRYRKRKPSIPIKDMIRALEGSQQLKPTRRGRPPKRRESTVSSVCSVDETSSSASTHELRYRELRDKNNEASKRSRMNRKLKELQMEQLAIELEEKNKKLRVRAEILEEMTKKIRADFMAAVSQNRLNS
ncbi:uncharacterized protein LOC106713238 isoform X1 [Papilio machaon]|uniref:uncharacterized protein LOC106713238 isoform X2 n=1 Tax=Papilio machaon TaxID=76193 RepID=UPI001E663082|nr:uncharacterized protein LOC106713238 isoform X2 [Papilio machaon]XP_045535400.1 uncharacterized protein LOC106713238 isoform X1 [Papilio machaon]